VSINKFTSEPFNVKSGVRQGDPLSCLLFNVVIESLALHILANELITGITDKNGHWHVLDLYANDMALILRSLQQYKELLRAYNTYAKATGSALNKHKTEIICALDTDAPPTYKEAKIVRIGRYLGTPIGPGSNLMAFWKNLHDKIKTQMAQWAPLFLSLRQRTAIAKTTLESTLWYYIRLVLALAKDIEPIERVILKFIWDLPSEARLAGPIKNCDVYHPIEEGGLGLVRIESMRQSLGLYWIQKLEKAQKMDPLTRPLWYSLITLILTHHTKPKIRDMIMRPWAQVWNRSTPRPPLSVYHFLKPWKVKDACIPPTNETELAAMDFWFHREINQKHASVLWYTPVWKELFFSTTTVPKIQTLGQLWAIKEGHIKAESKHQEAATRFFKNMPQPWRDINFEDLPNPPLPSHMGAFSKKMSTHIPVEGSTNNQIYEHMVQDTWGNDDLLETFKQLCARDRESLEGISNAMIWKSLRQAHTDYPKFTDLYWKLILGKVRTGETWMESVNCPICDITRTTEHLFWTCPAAKGIWQNLQARWQSITNTEVVFPTSWAGLLLSGVTQNKRYLGNQIHLKRWRIYFSEALWTIWLHRCAWSFKEITTYDTEGLKKRYDARITT
jgi:hypothetical protein